MWSRPPDCDCDCGSEAVVSGAAGAGFGVMDHSVDIEQLKKREFVHTHTLRAFCLQTSRAVTPTIMAMRNMPALMPSITPLRGSAEQKHSVIRGPLTFVFILLVLNQNTSNGFVLTSMGDHRQRQERVGEERRAVGDGEVVPVVIKQLSERSDAEPADRTQGTLHFNIAELIFPSNINRSS